MVNPEASSRPEAKILFVSAELNPRIEERIGAALVERVSSGVACCQAAREASYIAVVANFPLNYAIGEATNIGRGVMLSRQGSQRWSCGAEFRGYRAVVGCDIRHLSPFISGRGFLKLPFWDIRRTTSNC